MSRFWNKKTRELKPYIAGEQPKQKERIIKLNTNENPYPPSPLIKPFLEDFDTGELQKYPELTCMELRKEIAYFYGVSEENVFCGNGSDEVLALAFQTFFENGASALPLSLCDISYSFYPVYLQMYDIPSKPIPLREDFSTDIEPFLEPSGGVVLANPNAPTAMAESKEDIVRVIESQPDRVVLIDEAYAGFGVESIAPLVKKYDNLLVVGTASKSRSLAGLRVGWAIGSPELIEGLRRVRDSFNSYPVDTLAMKIASISFRDVDTYKKNCKKIVKTREKTVKELEKMGFFVLPSEANFIFASPKRVGAEFLYKKLKEKGILIRYFPKPRISDFLRITIGSDVQMEIFLDSVSVILAENGGSV